MNLDARRMVDDDQLGLVEIEDFAEFVGGLQHERTVARRKVADFADTDELGRVGRQILAAGVGEAGRRVAQQIGDEAKAIAIPGVQVWTRSGGDLRLADGDRPGGIDRDAEGVFEDAVGPGGSQAVEALHLTEADFDRTAALHYPPISYHMVVVV